MVEVPVFNCAIDLGASGGRVMLGEFDGDRVKLIETHRFPNEPVSVNGVMYWDVLRLFHEIKMGLKKIANQGVPLAGIGVDAWGVDYALLGKDGHMTGMPVHYRDTRTDGCEKKAEKLGISLKSLYAKSGIQFLPFNTLFQLISDAEMRPGILREASDLLFIPDLIAYFLTGKKINEYTIASTSQLIDAAVRDWDESLFALLQPEGLRRLFKNVTQPGTPVGPLLPEIMAETGFSDPVQVIAAGSHDTASAVAGTPLTGEGCAYISCGTWSLLGLELDTPCLTEASYNANFTNEGGLDGKIRYLKNINGLWMIQQLLKSYNDRAAHESTLTFPDIIQAAENAERKHFRVTPNDPVFNNPPDMAEAVRCRCESTGQGIPDGLGETALAIYNGLTGEYAAALKDLETLQNTRIKTVHMVGGGVRDTLLCHMTAKAAGKRILAGPVEASALGNIAAQWIGLGVVNNLSEARAVIRRSFEPAVYEA